MNGNRPEYSGKDDLTRMLEERTAELRDCEEQLMECRRRLEELNRTLEEKIRGEAEKNQILIFQSRQAAMGEMLGNIAHQWRQPLTAVSLLIQDLRESYIHGELSREYMERNVGNALNIIHHMSQTINDFRDFFKRDKVSRSFSVREILERTVSFIEASLRYGNIAVTIEAEEGLTAVGYPNEFSQALLNIIGNAKDILRERKVSNPEIRIRAFRDGDRTVVTITDNGGGIPDAVIDRIFEPYFSTRPPDVGTGLGLSMSRTIIEKNMGGTLTAANVAGGACFRIEI